MSEYDDRVLDDIEGRMLREDPQFARAMASGCPREAYRSGDSRAPGHPHPERPLAAARRRPAHRAAWALLTGGLGAFGVGIGVGDGLLIALGLVAAGAAGHLFDPQRRTARQAAHRGTPPLR